MKIFFKIIIRIYLKLLTKVVLWRHKPFIVAIAGTSNKTFVKEVILNELGRSPQVRGNPKSFNTEIGLPLAVLFLPSGYSSVFKWADVLLTGTCISFFARKFPKVLVLEMGVSRDGDMDYLLSLIRPDISVITGIDESLYCSNQGRQEIAKEISKLAITTPKDGLIIVNGDNAKLKQLVRVANSRKVFFGQSGKVEARIEKIENHGSSQVFELNYLDKIEKIEIERHGYHHIEAKVIAVIIKNEIKKVDL